MQILNIHTRTIKASPGQIANLLATLGSAQDQVWPHEDWMPMRLDRPIAVGASGGHGPIRYEVTHYEPSRCIRFDFLRGSRGYHQIDLHGRADGRCELKHTICTQPSVKFAMAWFFFIRSIHDALIEDLFDKLQSRFEPVPQRHPWSMYVKWLRSRQHWSGMQTHYPKGEAVKN